ncbi:unnamed protein product [Rotaria sp. Silwood2]|nr:unnamed protein product [Rotaria sp. Silwood2]
MFFWLFPAQNESTVNTSLIIWLNAGPGISSLFGLFNQIDPLFIDVNGNIQLRFIKWNKNYHLLCNDNPVGTGFSFTSNDQGFARTEDDFAGDLYECLTQVFQIYIDYASNSFYIAGESFARKYVPALTYKILY